jgi:hypothetical protein
MTRHASAIGSAARAFSVVMLLWASSAQGRTIVLNATDSDRMAGIAESAPRQSWAMYEYRQGYFITTALSVAPNHSFLFRLALDKIPPGHRIAHAELILPVVNFRGSDPRFYLWRILPDWGPGVNWIHRTGRPEKIEWTKAGGRGISSDRATRPTDVVRLTAIGEVAINVTEDVELWYSGAATNNGWMITVEDPDGFVQIGSPVWDQAAAWKLRVTYEPVPTDRQAEENRPLSHQPAANQAG